MQTRLHHLAMTAGLLACLSTSLTACGGGAPHVVPSSGPVTLVGEAISERAWDIAHPAQATRVPASADLLYVSNIGTNSITVYHHDQQANTAPQWTIAGSKTMLSHPGQLAEDASGNLYVANNSYPMSTEPSGAFTPSVLVFAPHAKGNVAPIRVVAGPATGILSIDGMTVDQTTGKLYVTSTRPGLGDVGANLIRFAPGSNGNATPFATGFIGEQTGELAQDSSGKNLIMFQINQQYTPDAVEVTIEKQFANGTAPLWKRTIGGSLGFTGTTDDPTTRTFLTTGAIQECAQVNPSANPFGVSGIFRFAESTNGDVVGLGGCGYPPTAVPVSVITSDTCGGQLALGYLRNIYVVHSQSAGCPTDAVYVYQHDAAGNATPLRVLSGPATQLSNPAGIYEGS